MGKPSVPHGLLPRLSWCASVRVEQPTVVVSIEATSCKASLSTSILFQPPRSKAAPDTSLILSTEKADGRQGREGAASVAQCQLDHGDPPFLHGGELLFHLIYRRH